MKKLVTVLTVMLLAGVAANATIIGQEGRLDSTANGGLNPETGVAWAPGDIYVMAFVSSGTRDATDPNISTYQTFLQNAATTAGIGGVTWYCVGQSANNPTRNTNAPTMATTHPIMLADGLTKLADDGADLANGPDVFYNITETGGTYNGGVASGSSRTFGSVNGPPAKNEIGNSNRTDGGWWQVYNTTQTTAQHFYALSEELTVVPEPATLSLLGFLGLGLLVRRLRR